MANPVGSLEVRLGLKSQEFINGMRGVQNQLKLADAQFRASSTSSTNYGNKLAQLTAKQTQLQSKMRTQGQSLEFLRRQYELSAQALGKNHRETQNLAIRLNNTQASYNRLQQQLSRVNADIAKQTSTWGQLEAKLQTVSSKLQTVSQGFEKAGTAISKGISAPAAAVGGFAIKTAADFEAGMSKVKAVSGASAADIEALGNKAREMGSKTSKSATEAAQGMEYMALAGWDTNQMLSGIEPLLRLAEAGSMDLGRASDLVTDSMSAMGIQVKDMPAYLDVMAQTSRNSNTSIDQLGEAFLRVGGTFKGLNIGVEEGAAVLGVLANSGLKAGEAGNSLQSILVNLTAPTGQAAKALEELGFNAFDSEGKFKGLGVILPELKEKMAGMTDEQRNQMISMIAGKEQIKTFNALLTGMDGDFQKLTGKIANSNGALNEMATVMQDNLKGQITALKSGLEEAGIAIGTALLPRLKTLVAGIQGAVTWFNGLDQATKANVATAISFAAALGPTILIFGKIAGAMASAINGFTMFYNVVSKLSILARLGTLIQGVATAFRVLTVAMLANPFVAVAAAIAALAAGFVYLWKTNEDFRNAVIGIWEGIKTFFIDTWTTITTAGPEMFSRMWSGITEGASAAWDGLTSTMSNAWSTITSTASAAWSGFTTMLSNVWTSVTAGATAAWTAFTSLLDSVWSGITSAATAAWSGFVSVITGFWNQISSDAMSIFDGFANYFTGIWEVIKNIFLGAILIIVDLVTLDFQGLSNDVQGIWNNLKNAFSQIWEGIKQIFSGAVGIIGTVLSNAWNFMTNTAQSIWNALKSFFSSLWSGMKSLFTTSVSAIGNALKSGWNGMINGAKSLWNSLKAFFTSLWSGMKSLFTSSVNAIGNGIKSGFTSAVNGAKSLWTGFKSFISGMWTALTSDFPRWVSNIANSVKTGFTNMLNNVKSTMTQIPGAISSAWNSAVSFLKGINLASIGKDIIQGLVNGIKSMAGAVAGAVSDVASGIKDKIRGALNIGSPSRVTMGYGEDVGKGLEIGMTKRVGFVAASANKLAQAALPNMNDTVQTAMDQGAALRGAQGMAGSFTQNLTINSPRELSPAEIARKNRGMARELALQWGM